MERFVQRLDKAKKAIDESEYIIIGAGAGLSTAAGIDYGGERHEKYFKDFIEKYGFTDMYSSSFYKFQTPKNSGPIGQDIFSQTGMMWEKPMFTLNYSNW